MAAHDDKVVVRPEFIGRSLSSTGVLYLLKAAAWTTVFGTSQALGSSYYEQVAVARKAGAAVNMSVVKRDFLAKSKVFLPSILAHNFAFLMIRGNGDTRGIYPGLFPLACVAAPSIAYSVVYRAQPPQALRFGVLSAAVLHVYDRVLKPAGILESEMPTTRLHRQLW